MIQSMLGFHCRICEAPEARLLQVSSNPIRKYMHCSACSAVFVDPDDHLSMAQERQFYLTHENDPDEIRYRTYLMPLLELANRATAQIGQTVLKHGCLRMLDFGSGPLPPHQETFGCSYFKKLGWEVSSYDPYFRPHDLEGRKYELIFACEVVEHFRNPLKEFEKLVSHLSKVGVLAIQTQILPDIVRFDEWYYRRDPTHVAFYSAETFAVLAEKLGLAAPEIFDDKRIILKSKSTELDLANSPEKFQ